MSVTAAAMGLAVLLIRRIRAIPRRISIFLWLVPYLRMCVPVWISSRYSLMTLISRFAARKVTVFVPMDSVEFSMMNTVRAANGYFPLTFKVNVLDGLFRTAGIVWAAVAAALVITLIAVYAATLIGIRKAEPAGGRTYVSDRVKAPAVFGILKPRIVLPAGAAADRFTLLHEEAHIRRLDNLWRLIAVFITAVHWFDPFAWVFLKAFLSDIELACDESVISKLGGEERKDYARALLKSAEERSVFASPFGGAGLKTRIGRILSYRGATAASAVCFALVTGAIVWLLLTNAK